MNKRIVASALVAAAVFAVALGLAVAVLSMTATPAEAGPCRCPQVYAPVTCDNGKTYPNQCVADCRHATGCVPSGGI